MGEWTSRFNDDPLSWLLGVSMSSAFWQSYFSGPGVSRNGANGLSKPCTGSVSVPCTRLSTISCV